MINTKILSSLEKCFWDERLEDKTEKKSFSMLKNERLSFQIAYQPDWTFDGRYKMRLRIEADEKLLPSIRYFRVMNVPSMLPVLKSNEDTNYLRRAPGLYPDLLVPYTSEINLPLVDGQLLSVWVEIENPQVSGDFTVGFVFTSENGEEIGRTKAKIHIVAAELPKQELIYTNWFYTDCLMTYYRTGMFDNEHFRIIGNFMECAAKNGINMILTPVFTPALDTGIGLERPTVQLVKVKKTNGEWSFDFRLLGKFCRLALEKGIEYFEISHFFTQWGAKCAPKVIAEVDGVEKRIFGWDTPATGEYADFLRIFIPKLLAYLKRIGVDKRCYFHISDEPNQKNLEYYQAAKNVVSDLLKGYPIMDAISSFEFYQKGILEMPVPSINHAEPFIEAKIPGLWCYYCSSQRREVSNRFLAMPSERNRVIGTQWYKYEIVGFLHWGFNFWYSHHSEYPIDPFLTTDGDYFCESGDHFVVYPAPDGSAYPTMRLRVFYEAIQDQRAYKLLEKLKGRKFVMRLIDKSLGDLDELTMKQYPTDPAWLLGLREKVNKEIEKAL